MVPECLSYPPITQPTPLSVFDFIGTSGAFVPYVVPGYRSYQISTTTPTLFDLVVSKN